MAFSHLGTDRAQGTASPARQGSCNTRALCGANLPICIELSGGPSLLNPQVLNGGTIELVVLSLPTAVRAQDAAGRRWRSPEPLCQLSAREVIELVVADQIDHRAWCPSEVLQCLGEKKETQAINFSAAVRTGLS